MKATNEDMLKELLKDKRSTILHSWRERIFDSYPADSHRFLKGEKDQFANPVGYAIRQSTEPILDGLINGVNLDELSKPLDMLIRVRSVQDFSASQAVAFVSQLKLEVREILAGHLSDRETLGELLEFELLLDKLMHMAFDIHMQCRETVAQIRVNQVRDQSATLFERLNRPVSKGENKNEPHEGGNR